MTLYLINGIIDTVVRVEGVYRYSRDEGTYAELEAVILCTQVCQNVHFVDMVHLNYSIVIRFLVLFPQKF